MQDFAQPLQNASYQTGAALAEEIYFSVSWPWLLAPIASVLFTLVFLFATALKSSRAGIPAWKSSELASMMALSQGAKEILGNGLRSLEDMEKRVEQGNVTARLERLGDEETWQLAGMRRE